MTQGVVCDFFYIFVCVVFIEQPILESYVYNQCYFLPV